MRVQVEADDIYHGEVRSSNRCPVALALLRTLPGYTWDLGPNTIVGVSPSGARIELESPEEVHEFISEFDDGDYGMPFSFELDLEATDAD